MWKGRIEGAKHRQLLATPGCKRIVITLHPNKKTPGSSPKPLRVPSARNPAPRASGTHPEAL